MRIFPHLRYSLIALAVAAVSFTEHIVAVVDTALERCIDFLVSAFEAAPRERLDDVPAIVPRVDRAELPAPLLESLRHEKGAFRIAAARGG